MDWWSENEKEEDKNSLNNTELGGVWLRLFKEAGKESEA